MNPKRTIAADVIAAVIHELDHPTDPAWVKAAPCRGLDVSLFYPARGERGPAMCDGCPFAVPCVTTAIARFDDFGVWGGYAERPRRAIARAVRAVRPDLLTSVWLRPKAGAA